MNHWQSGDVSANGIRMHYTRTGGAKPPLVLAHGVTDDGLCWTPLAEALAGDYDVVMVDARGHGLSDGPDTGYDPHTQAEDLRGVIAALELRQPVLLGHSMGAVTVLALAGLHPGLPRAILLEDPPAFWLPPPPSPNPPAQDGARDAPPQTPWFVEVKRKSREQLIADARQKNPDWPEAELGPWADAKLRFSPNVFMIFHPRTRAMRDWPAVLRGIACPALVITADPERGAVLKADGLAALQSLAPSAQVAHVPGAGHNIRREQFARYLDAVRGFLSNLPAS
jgi:pimeloyl-ACP methyl ester carboxylesterase